MDFENLVSVKFEINNKQLTMPGLIALKHLRPHVVQLFEELQSKGFGVYTPGRVGVGHCAKFDPNEKCPTTYTIFVEGKSKKKIVVEEAEVSSDPLKAIEVVIQPKIEVVEEPKLKARRSFDDAPEATRETQTLHSLWSLSKTLVEDVTSDAIGYDCTIFANQILVLHRIRGGGKYSIEAALNEVWKQIEDRVIVSECRDISKIEAVVSALKGLGILVLAPVGCTCGVKK